MTNAAVGVPQLGHRWPLSFATSAHQRALRRQAARVGLVLLWYAMLPLMASDLAKERRWAEQLVDSLLDGEPVWLEANGHPFLTLYTEADNPSPPRAAIILHGIGTHPDWPQVVHPLRVQLAERGWSTLSLQLPVLRNEATASEYASLFDQAADRIAAGLVFLRERNIENIALIGHSLGAAMGAYYLSTQDGPVAAFVGIGMPSNPQDRRLDTVSSLEQISIPVLDIFGSDDLPDVLRAANERAASSTATGNRCYRQLRVAGADHFFAGQEDRLVQEVTIWLTETLP